MQGLESFVAILQFTTGMNLVLASILPMKKIYKIAGCVNLDAPEKSLDGKPDLNLLAYGQN